MPEHSTARERVEFGLDSISPDSTVTVRLRDLMFVNQTLSEFMQFFHQPMHYPDIDAVHRFLQKSGCGGFDVLREALYVRMHEMLPPEIHEAFAQGERFEHPLPPKYYSPSGDQESDVQNNNPSF